MTRSPSRSASKDLDQLKDLIRGQLEQELNRLTRTHMKRQLLDLLAAATISRCRRAWSMPSSSRSGPARHEAEPEEDPKAALAEIERRVRATIARSPSGACASACCCRRSAPATASRSTSRKCGCCSPRRAAISAARTARRSSNTSSRSRWRPAQLRAPLYEDKVVDFLFSKANITDRSATREELEADLETTRAMCMVRAAATTTRMRIRPKQRRPLGRSRPRLRPRRRSRPRGRSSSRQPRPSQQSR